MNEVLGGPHTVDCKCERCQEHREATEQAAAEIAKAVDKAEAPPPKTRANYVPAPHYFNLNMACSLVRQAFEPYDDFGIYLVGSSLDKREWRDVDVRLIMSDEGFAKLFNKCDPGLAYLNPLWCLLCSSISLWLKAQSGLPIDFQIQQQTAANSKEPGAGRRHPLGLFLTPNPPDYASSTALGLEHFRKELPAGKLEDDGHGSGTGGRG